MAAHIKSIAEMPVPLYPWQKPAPDKVTIGVVDPCYGSSHVIYGLETERYEHRTLATLPLRKLDRGVTFFQFTPVILQTGVPLIHTWNAIPLNGNFIVSFELELPRYLGGPSAAQVKRGLSLLENPRCKGIFALSDFAFTFARDNFAKHGFAHLTDKMDVFRGAVPDVYAAGETRTPRYPRASFSEKPFSAVVIGTQLFRKGGMYAIKAFEKLHAAGRNVQLTLIGDFETDSYAFGDYIPDAAEWRARARSHDWIRFIGPVPNTQVFAELLAHDVCIYASLDESLGWLPIEAGKLGVPVIGAKVCAFPELVEDGGSGWLVDMPLRADGRWAGLEVTGAAKREALDDADVRITRGIEQACIAAYDDPALLEKWGLRGRERMDAMYGFEGASRRLEAIYDETLARC